jgi:hypothetical protein
MQTSQPYWSVQLVEPDNMVTVSSSDTEEALELYLSVQVMEHLLDLQGAMPRNPHQAPDW